MMNTLIEHARPDARLMYFVIEESASDLRGFLEHYGFSLGGKHDDRFGDGRGAVIYNYNLEDKHRDEGREGSNQ